MTNCVFLQDNENNARLSLSPRLTIDWNSVGIPFHVVAHEEGTYALLSAYALPMDVDLIASYFGGHPVTINSAEEQTLVTEYWLSKPYLGKYAVGLMGLTDEGTPGEYRWVDGTPLTYTNWESEELPVLPIGQNHYVWFRQDNSYPNWHLSTSGAGT